ncbi:hypothetical protein P692DRAFT_201085990 [Suillus brevipes Sb2]|nr:hypothetical protein P692DRAFT_201085990 [Suillus brevipes Sb2]
MSLILISVAFDLMLASQLSATLFLPLPFSGHTSTQRYLDVNLSESVTLTTSCYIFDSHLCSLHRRHSRRSSATPPATFTACIH